MHRISGNARAAFALAVALVLAAFAGSANAVSIDLTSGTTGTLRINQSFNGETRAAEVTLLGLDDQIVLSMQVRGIDIRANGVVGARIYDSGTGALIASAGTSVAVGENQTIAVPISATLIAGETYRLAFFVPTSSSGNQGDLFDPAPSGPGGFGYVESQGLFRVDGAFQILGDSFPTTPSGTSVAQISLFVVPDLIDHFKVYNVDDTDISPPQEVELVDQFGSENVTVSYVDMAAAPVSKNGEVILDPNAFQTWYPISDPGHPLRRLRVTNQFGTHDLQVEDPTFLVVPAALLPQPPPLQDNHFKCYAVVDPRPSLGLEVSLETQVGPPEVVTVTEALLFCNPVSKNGSPVAHPDDHLTCYDIEPKISLGIPATAEDQFGIHSSTIRENRLLCVPSSKTLLPPVDHFKVYNVDDTPIPPELVLLEDQFGQELVEVYTWDMFATPADKNSEGISDPLLHGMVYPIDSPGHPLRWLSVTNQFGAELLRIGDPRYLVNPAQLLPLPPSSQDLHFKCYDVVQSPPPAGNWVVLETLFGFELVQVFEALLFCNPVSKNGSGIPYPDEHLTCYDIQPQDPLDVPVNASDQFGNSYSTIRENLALCVPSTKIMDSDGDGLVNSVDNCLLVANGPAGGVCYSTGVQVDTDGDGFGNPCDGDFSNDGAVNSSDVVIFYADLATGVPTAGTGTDMNCDGAVNSSDVVLFNPQISQGFPGP